MRDIVSFWCLVLGWLTEEWWKSPMSKPVSCPLSFCPEMLIGLTEKVNTCRVVFSFCRSGQHLQSLNGSSSLFKEGHPTNPWQDVFFQHPYFIHFLLPWSRRTKLAQTRQFHLLLPALQLEKSNLWLKVEGLCGFHLLDSFETNCPTQLGQTMTRADGKVGIGS